MSVKYRKKLGFIEAVQWDGNNVDEVMSFIKNVTAYNVTFGTLDIQTLERNMTILIGDWIIKGIKNEFDVCKRKDFEATYERASYTQGIFSWRWRLDETNE
jgi:hypothetical protein